MSNFTLSLSGQKPLTGILDVSEPLQLPAGLVLRRILHDRELWLHGITDPRNTKGTWLWRAGNPEVFTFSGSHPTKMLEWVQRLSYALNPGMTGQQWRNLYAGGRAFANQGAGFGDARDLRDYINGIDLTASEYPRFDQSRICGGATIAGRINGMWLEVETLRVDQPVSLEYVKARPWLTFAAVTVAASSTAEREIVGDFPQSNTPPVVIPLVTTYPVRYPLNWTEATATIADPYMVRQ